MGRNTALTNTDTQQIAAQTPARQRMICVSLYRAVFIKNLLRYFAEKILLLNTTNWGGLPAEIHRAVLKRRNNVPNLATKVQHRVLSVFKVAVAEGLRADNPVTAEAQALPKAKNTPKKQPRASPF